jgi:hypothetical protein
MDEGLIPVGRCARCETQVLAVLWLDAGREERRACARCDAELDPAELEWLTEAELDALGYASYAEAEHCGRPDCGGGRCGRGD